MKNKMEKMKEVEAIIETIRNSDTELIFGKAIEENGKAIIPVGRIHAGLGFGYGEKEDQESSGGGGGFGIKVDPVGYIDIKGRKAKFVKVSRYSGLSAIAGAIIGVGAYKLMSSKKESKAISKRLKCCFK